MKKTFVSLSILCATISLYAQSINTSFPVRTIGGEERSNGAVVTLQDAPKLIAFQEASDRSVERHLPCPVLFIHGTASSSDAWETVIADAQNHYDLSFAGTFRYHLEWDNDYTYSDLTSVASSDVYDFQAGSQVVNADLYCLSFNMYFDGTILKGSEKNPYLSNQAAIRKQGLAIRQAVNSILNGTGASHVMLVCHSAGGLAAREYIQSQDLWQTDGQHHVSRLVTLGTPHGGIYFNDLSGAFATVMKDVDVKSDIIRDMRRQTISSNNYFPYLYGGKESSNNFAKNYYNYDINCNGKTSENVLGLNKKPQPFVEATSIIAYSEPPLFYSSDGIVDAADADIKSIYPNMDAETFYSYNYKTGSTPHQVMTDNVKDLWTGMDEADYFSFAPTIKTDQQYWGIFSRQSPIDAPDTEARDYDDYAFKLNRKSTMQIWLQYEMLSGQAVAVQIFKKSQLLSPIMQISLQKGQQYTSEFILPAGEYYLEFVYDADVLSYLKQYKFILFDNTSSVATNDVEKEDEGFFYPNPASDFITIRGGEENEEVKITDMQGREVLRSREKTINISNLPTGLYIVQKGEVAQKLQKI